MNQNKYKSLLLLICVFAILPQMTDAKNYCLSFGPECDDYVTVPYSTDFDFYGPFTIECWFMVRGPHKNDHIPLISNYGPEPTSGIGWQIGLFKPESEVLPTHVTAAYYGDIEDNQAPFDVVVGKWYHLAFTYDGEVARLFLNGRLAQRIKCALKPHNSDQPITIGGQSGNWWNRNLNGMIDEVRISNTCRYTEDFTPRDFFDLNEGTIALWHFNEGKGDTVYDEGPYMHHGVIHGAQWVKLSDGESNSFKHLPSPLKAQRNYFLVAAILLLLTSAGLSILYWKRARLQIQPASDNNHVKQTASWLFLAQRMTHQMKTPLSTILMSLERIQQEYQKKLKPEDAQRADTYVEGATQEIKRLIDSSRAFMQFLKIEAPVFEVTEIACFLDQFLQKYKMRVSAGIVFETDFQPGLFVKMDPTLMSVVLENLLDNALKAMDSEGILRLAASCTEEVSPQSGQVQTKAEIEIEDSGRGMSPEIIERIFQPYVTQAPDGTGLGLFVARRIIEDHGGQICIKSREGIGTKVMIELPALSEEECRGKAL